MIKGKTIKKRDVFDKPHGDKKVGSIDANVEITASENIFQWLHLTDGGWVSAGPRQQYIKWGVVPDFVEPPPPPTIPDLIDTQLPSTETRKIIKGKTVKKRDIFNKPRGNKRIGSLDANVEITATENIFQWLHLTDGGWVSAGHDSNTLNGKRLADSVEPPPPPTIPDPIDTQPPSTETRKFIKGKTVKKREVFNKPRGDKRTEDHWSQCGYYRH